MDPTLRRRVTVGLNKGEARNALARAVYFNRLGEVRDRSFESQRYRARGLNMATAAIILWNTVYIEKALQHLKEQGEEINPITPVSFTFRLGRLAEEQKILTFGSKENIG